MLPKWKEVEPMVLTLLKDEVPEGSNRKQRYDPHDVVNWWNNAQIRLATMKPQQRHQVYRPDDGKVLDLPAYFYKPAGMFMAGQPFDRIKMVEAAMGKEGYYIADGKLILALQSLPREMLLIYDCYYPNIAKDEEKNSPVYVPGWAHEACAIYVALQAITREAVADARYRKFTSPEDAPGNPTHNPFLTVAKWMRERFYEIINTHVDDDQDFRK